MNQLSTFTFQAFVSVLLIGIAVGAPKGSENLPGDKEEHLDKEQKDYKLKEGEADVAGLHLDYLVVFVFIFCYVYIQDGYPARAALTLANFCRFVKSFKSNFHTFLCIQCTKSAKGICPEDKLRKEEVDLEEKEKTCIDSAKLLRCIRSVRIVCPKSTN